MSKVLEYYSASWCQPCKMFGPVMDELHKDYPEVTFVKYMLDDQPEKAIEAGVTAVPTLILKDGEKEEFRLIGAKPRPYLDKNLVPKF